MRRQLAGGGGFAHAGGPHQRQDAAFGQFVPGPRLGIEAARQLLFHPGAGGIALTRFFRQPRQHIGDQGGTETSAAKRRRQRRIGGALATLPAPQQRPQCFHFLQQQPADISVAFRHRQGLAGRRRRGGVFPLAQGDQLHATGHLAVGHDQGIVTQGLTDPAHGLALRGRDKTMDTHDPLPSSAFMAAFRSVQ
ncbi:hypothetical protein ACEK07_06790 [Alcanivoracaceae bacterium MT1]